MSRGALPGGARMSRYRLSFKWRDVLVHGKKRVTL